MNLGTISEDDDYNDEGETVLDQSKDTVPNNNRDDIVDDDDWNHSKYEHSTCTTSSSVPSHDFRKVYGIICGRSIRSSFACLYVAKIKNNDNNNNVVGLDGTKIQRSKFLANETTTPVHDTTTTKNSNNDDDTTKYPIGFIESYKPLLIRIQFGQPPNNELPVVAEGSVATTTATTTTDLSSLRSYCRRFYKIGDLILIEQNYNRNNINHPTAKTTTDKLMHVDNRNEAYGYINSSDSDIDDEDNNNKDDDHTIDNNRSQASYNRLILHNMNSVEDLQNTIHTQQQQFWSMKRCQQWQNKYIRPSVIINSSATIQQIRKAAKRKQQQQQSQQQQASNTTTPFPKNDDNTINEENNHHSSTIGIGLSKRMQGQYVANFLIHMIARKIEIITTSTSDITIRVESDSTITDTNLGDKNDPFSKTNNNSWESVLGDPSTWATRDVRKFFETYKQSFNNVRSKHQDVVDEINNNEQEKQIQQRRIHLLRMAILKLNNNHNYCDHLDPITSTVSDGSDTQNAEPTAKQLKNGVIDAAGGAGHVSLALGLAGVQSTVIDPRTNVGRLPGRDRKVWSRALRNRGTKNTSEPQPPLEMPYSEFVMYCQPIQTVPIQEFKILRAWFGMPISGVDESFRTPDCTKETIPIVLGSQQIMATHSVSSTSDPPQPIVSVNRASITAIVALHPDEATDAIVDMAVQERIPFCIVPCCVFHRLFPHRRKPIVQRQSGRTDTAPSTLTNDVNSECREENSIANNINTSSTTTVSTYADLLDYLQAKHPSIQRSALPFPGPNVILWSYF